MWIADYITKNSMTNPSAEIGNVVSCAGGSTAVMSSGEHKGLKTAAPYGIISVPPVGENAVILPLDDSEVCIGVVADSNDLEPGELKLCSKGGASIVLKNDGSVLINGVKYGG